MDLEKKLCCNTIGCKMAYAVKGILRLMQQRFNKHGLNLTIEQYFVLNILDNREGLILQDLSELLGRDKSAVLRHIDGLEKHFYVARQKDPQDKRRKILLVTKKGAEIFEEAKRLAEEVNNELTRHIPADELDDYKNNIDKIYEKAFTSIE